MTRRYRQDRTGGYKQDRIEGFRQDRTVYLKYTGLN